MDFDHFKVTLKLRSALFWDVTQRQVVIVCRRFGITYLSHLEGSRLFLLLDFLILEAGPDTLSRNVDKRSSHDTA
jgi:hypothetical protein